MQVLGEQLVQPDDPGDPLGELGLAQPSSRLALDLHVVVVLGPVVPDEQHPSSCSYQRSCEPAGELPAA
jgi:hypothetical protein